MAISKCTSGGTGASAGVSPGASPEADATPASGGEKVEGEGNAASTALGTSAGAHEGTAVVGKESSSSAGGTENVDEAADSSGTTSDSCNLLVVAPTDEAASATDGELQGETAKKSGLEKGAKEPDEGQVKKVVRDDMVSPAI